MASKLNRIGKDIMSAMKNATEQGTSAYDTTAEVRRVEGDIAWVHIAGGVDETPVKLTVSAKAGDSVQVRVCGGRAWITGNATAPPTDDRQANIATEKAETAEKKVSVVQKIADTARKIAGNTNQYFWHTQEGTDTGAHITEKPQEEFLADPENGGGNLLARSNGMAVRDGLTELATFGASGAQIGQSGAAHSVIDANGQRFYASDGSTQLANIGYGEGTAESGTATAPYYTFGKRKNGSVIGNYSTAEGISTTASGYSSHAEGHNTTASGYNSHAEGDHTTASSYYSHAGGYYTVAGYSRQTVIGRYNSNKSDTVFEIGNGNDLERSNALTVDWNGNLWIAGHYTSAITACGATGTADLALSTSEKKVNLSSNRARVGADLTNNNGGVKCAKSGYVEVSGAIYCRTGFTANDYVHLVIRRGSTLIVNAVHRIPNDYDYYSVAPIVYPVSVGDILYLYAYNQSGARGQISAATESWLTVKYL